MIMDVVYNHLPFPASAFHKLVPGYYYRHRPDGGFSNGSGCGNELADERSMVRKFIVDSVTYWAKEYKIAGFRFDLMGLHHLETMQAVRRALDAVDPQILIYGEGWAAGPSTLPEGQRALKENTIRPGIASFCVGWTQGHVFHTEEGVHPGTRLEKLSVRHCWGVQHPKLITLRFFIPGPWARILQACLRKPPDN